MKIIKDHAGYFVIRESDEIKLTNALDTLEQAELLKAMLETGKLPSELMEKG